MMYNFSSPCRPLRLPLADQSHCSWHLLPGFSWPFLLSFSQKRSRRAKKRTLVYSTSLLSHLLIFGFLFCQCSPFLLLLPLLLPARVLFSSSLASFSPLSTFSFLLSLLSAELLCSLCPLLLSCLSFTSSLAVCLS